jgi:predicted Zn-dependent protease
MKYKFVPAWLFSVLFLASCAVNPVTGERNLQFYGADWEKNVGAQMYAPMKQSQGGEFVLDPELTTYVQEVGNRLTQQARRKDELEFEFSVLNDSIPNAWALPGGKIVINRGLLTELGSEAELAAVLGHEIVHADAAHGARAQSKGVLTQIGAVATMVVLGTQIDNGATREVAMIVPALGAQLLTQKYGRDAERESDEYGMLYMSEAGYDTQGAIALQETFVKLSEGRNPDWLSGLFASHPPSMERVENNRKTAANLPAGGTIGSEQYLRKTAYLRRVKPAYAAFDEANEALQKDNPALAQEKLNEAMALEPRESKFHDLQGDIYAMDGKFHKARKSYKQAIRANDRFFYGYLRKGQVEYKLENPEVAESDLKRSLELMPTAEAHFILGSIERDRKDKNAAIEHFKVAAQSDSEAGRQAQRELAMLDLAQNPSNYVSARAAVDRDNSVWCVIGNQTGVAMKNIVIRYAWLDDQGQTRESSTTYKGPLPGGKQDQVKLGIRLNDAAELSRRVRVQVTGARVAERVAE